MKKRAQVPHRGLPGWAGSLWSHPLGTDQHPFTIHQGFIEGLLYVDLLGANEAASLEMGLALPAQCSVLVRCCRNLGGGPVLPGGGTKDGARDHGLSPGCALC